MNQKTIIIIILVLAVAAIVVIYYLYNKKAEKRNEELMAALKLKALGTNIIYDEKTGKVCITPEPLDYLLEQQNEYDNENTNQDDNSSQEGNEQEGTQLNTNLQVVKNEDIEQEAKRQEENFKQDELDAEEIIEKETKPAKKVKAPDYINKEMKQRLIKLGYSIDDIKSMKPKQAWAILQNKTTKATPEEYTRTLAKSLKPEKEKTNV